MAIGVQPRGAHVNCYRLVTITLIAVLGSSVSAAAPTSQSSPKYQALLHAIVQSDVNGARALLSQGLNPDARVHAATEDNWIVDNNNPADQPLLVVAGRFGVPDSPFVAMLLERKATPDIRDARDRTPLMYAAQLGWSPSIDLLLQRHADVNAADADGVTVLMHAMGNRNIGVVAALLRAGARVNAADQQGRTPLMYALERARQDPVRIYGRKDDPQAADARYLELVRHLIEHGANVTARDKSGATPLKIAARIRLPELTVVLRNAGARD